MWTDANLGDSSISRQQIYDLLNEKKEEYKNNVEFLWRLARSTHDVSNALPKTDIPNRKGLVDNDDLLISNNLLSY